MVLLFLPLFHGEATSMGKLFLEISSEPISFSLGPHEDLGWWHQSSQPVCALM